jgi:hypothetical protein
MARTVAKRQRRQACRHNETIRDIWGDRWLVGERRPTHYRFAIYMGWPYPESGLQKSGKAAVIVTASLSAHMRAHAMRPYAYPLPIGDNARRRVRELLGIGPRQWMDARLNWWLDRIDDLGTLSSAKFVAKHRAEAWTRMGNLSAGLVWKMRVALLGRQRPPVGWWRSPEIRTLVNSQLSVDAIAKRLGVSPLTVYGIRYRIKKLTRR